MKAHRAEWIGMLTSVCVVLGGLLALTVKTQQAVGVVLPATRNSYELAQEWEVQQTKILRLQSKLNSLLGQRTASSDHVKLAMLAGMTPVTGPGVMVTLSDSPSLTNTRLDPSLAPPTLNMGIIHDVDILRVVNELFAAGAEAVAVNGQRIGPLTAIRCVGPVININQVGQAAPFHVEAIGNPETLKGALHLPGGVLQELSNVGCVVNVEPRQVINLTAWDGAVPLRYATPVTTTKDQDQS